MLGLRSPQCSSVAGAERGGDGWKEGNLALARAEVTPSLSPPPPVPRTDFFPRVFFFFPFPALSSPSRIFLRFGGGEAVSSAAQPVCVLFRFVYPPSFSTHPPHTLPSLSCLSREEPLTMRSTGTGAAGTATASSGKAPSTPPADGDGRFSVLSWEQVQRLDHILEEAVPIHGRGNFPTLSVRPRRIVQVVRSRLEKQGITVHNVRLNGSAASHVLHQDSGLGYKDLDLIFGVDLKSEDIFQLVKDVVMDCLLDFLPEGVNKDKITPMTLKEAYVQKLVKVCNETDRWSLISLSNNSGKNVELKFVDSLRRQFEFSVDSFQIILDSLLLFGECSENPMSANFHPTVTGESMYGDFEEAIDHLRNRIIATRNPEEIRGGGLLKYCNLLVRGFQAKSEVDMKALQRYMCSRFFIDFPDIGEQQRKLECYLQSHFVGMESKRYDCLMTLHRVVNESTVCLMGHERRQTLNLIAMLALRVLAERNIIPTVTNVTCYYQPAPYISEINVNYYVTHMQPLLPCSHSYPTWLPCN